MRLFCVSVFAVVVAGCAVHPIPEDVTRLTAYDIVRKIRCEAKEIVEILYEERRLYELQPGLDASDRKLKDLSKRLQKVNTKSVELERKSEELARKRLDVKVGLENILREIRRIKSEEKGDSLHSSVSQEEIERLRMELEDLLMLRDRLDAERGKLGIADRKNVQEKVRVEIDIADEKKNRKSKFTKLIEFIGTGIGYNFHFEITENNNASGDATFVWPIHLGSFTLAIGAGDNKQRFSDRTIKLGATFADLIKVDDCVPQEERLAHRYPIKGRIGLDEVVEQYVLISEDKHSNLASGKKDIYTDTIRFTTEISGSVSPSFSIAPALGRTISADLDLAVDRKDVHEVVVSLVPYKVDTPKKPTEVKIVNIDDFAQGSAR